MPAVLLIGRTGYLGRALLKYWQSQSQAHQWQVWSTQHQDRNANDFLDLSYPQLRGYEEILPKLDYAVITSARSNLADCHKNPIETAKVNVKGSLDLAQALAAKGICPVLFSSDYVFDGQNAPYTEESPLQPINAYGFQKACLEQALQKNCETDYLLLRLTKLYDLKPGSKTLLTELLDRWQKNQKTQIAQDQYFNPLWIEDAVRAISELLCKQTRGLFNLGGPSEFSRLELAECLAGSIYQNLIERIDLAELGEPFIRPLDTRLKITKLQETLQHWQALNLHEACKKLKQELER
jgi:dTDP-4-dehydrorhamnose reductase